MLRIGVDVGGTFTDIVIYDEETGKVTFHKVLTNPRDISSTIVNGLKKLRIELSGIASIIHATTIGTNMFFGQQYVTPPKACLVTTKGFRDIIEIGRQNRPQLYNLFFSKPRPLIPRKYRYEVTERIDSNGNVITPIKRDEIYKLSKIINNEGFRVIIVAFINSHINGVHERIARDVLKQLCPKTEVIISSEVCPIDGEYERMTTTVVNGLLKPILSQYLDSLINKLRKERFSGNLLIMQSDGGVASIDYAITLPVGFIESGPAAGVVAVSRYTKILGDDLAISFDMGGTTAKAALVVNGNPLITDEYEVGGTIHYGRLIRGSGYPIKYPFIDLVEVSAGGGTIGWIDKGGALRVGPMSAGSYPGPACYGLGGKEPTITDANLTLGRLGMYLAGKTIRLDKDKAREAISKLADNLGVSVIEAAYNMIRIANNIMSRAIRIVTIERGYDPSKSVLYAFGGAGPLHACEIALELGIKRVKIPVHPGVFSAIGLLLSDYKVEIIGSVLREIDELTKEYIEDRFAEMEKKVFRVYGEKAKISFIKLLELRFKGQMERIQVSWSGSLEDCREQFKTQYLLKYGYIIDDPIEVAALRLQAYIEASKISIKRQKIVKYEPKPREYREVFINEDWYDVPIYRREELKSGAHIYGPAIIEEYDSTCLIPENFTATIDQYGNIVMEVY